MSRPSGLQRAFALARNGDGLSIAIIKRRLHDEGYEADKIVNPAALRQLRRILIDGRRVSWKQRLAQIDDDKRLTRRKGKLGDLQ